MQRKVILAVLPVCRFFSILLSISASAQSVASAATGQAAESGKPARPNILFIIMDDVGIDQMQIFGYGGTTPPLTPNINAISRADVRFRKHLVRQQLEANHTIDVAGGRRRSGDLRPTGQVLPGVNPPGRI